MGPVLVAGLDYTNLQIEGRLNGDVRQGENSADLIFNMNHMVSYISKYFTLEPGDLIWSGTMGRTRAMEPGDVYEVEIDLAATSNLFQAGHRIRLDISSSNFPRFDVNPNTGGNLGLERRFEVAEQTVYHDPEHPSQVVLPIIER